MKYLFVLLFLLVTTKNQQIQAAVHSMQDDNLILRGDIGISSANSPNSDVLGGSIGSAAEWTYSKLFSGQLFLQCAYRGSVDDTRFLQDIYGDTIPILLTNRSVMIDVGYALKLKAKITHHIQLYYSIGFAINFSVTNLAFAEYIYQNQHISNATESSSNFISTSLVNSVGISFEPWDIAIVYLEPSAVLLHPLDTDYTLLTLSVGYRIPW